ncbi:hypothetical protein D4Z93_09870 [Clostridium fermenticellae]|uniref:Thoeris protein ThsB TIR-like domain-containing protein n=1 Tax=Clostridium fermenticellae TaxID=2068654 RepID=A0A386H5L7_9CLOT|nr:TIR domain-containing protein [Clostridium fermenticellae]AYD40815.1 hypothetical protein D4Z93_09870 [Clostridium fermenticellae]
MGHKIFISYKYADDDVYPIESDSNETTTVRNYVDELQKKLGDSNEINKGESDGEDLSQLNKDTIWNKLRNRIYDSTITMVLISKNMKEAFKLEKYQWIPREISYSLKETSRIDKNGNPITSKTNAMLAIIIPDYNNSYQYYTYTNDCCESHCRTLLNNTLFSILGNNMFNIKQPDTKDCENNSTIYYGDSSYIPSVKWDDFIDNMDEYIDKAYEIQDNIDNYNIYKEIE